MNLVERVTHRNPSPPLTNDERRGLWAGKYYAIPEAVRYGLEAANEATLHRLPIPRHKSLVSINQWSECAG